jgi:hypothetical protein
VTLAVTSFELFPSEVNIVTSSIFKLTGCPGSISIMMMMMMMMTMKMKMKMKMMKMMMMILNFSKQQNLP